MSDVIQHHYSRARVTVAQPSPDDQANPVFDHALEAVNVLEAACVEENAACAALVFDFVRDHYGPKMTHVGYRLANAIRSRYRGR
jgi:hypothetical protein